MASSPVCVECSTPPATGSLKRCSQCQVALYCCTKCQKAHWPTHKLFCIPPTRHVDFRVASSWDEDEGPSPSYIACPPLPGFETTYREGEWSKLLDADDKIVAPGGYLKVGSSSSVSVCLNSPTFAHSRQAPPLHTPPPLKTTLTRSHTKPSPPTPNRQVFLSSILLSSRETSDPKVFELKKAIVQPSGTLRVPLRHCRAEQQGAAPAGLGLH